MALYPPPIVRNQMTDWNIGGRRYKPVVYTTEQADAISAAAPPEPPRVVPDGPDNEKFVDRYASALPLDVERLAEAMRNTASSARSPSRIWADAIAAEYARLSESGSPPTPEQIAEDGLEEARRLHAAGHFDIEGESGSPTPPDWKREAKDAADRGHARSTPLGEER